LIKLTKHYFKLFRKIQQQTIFLEALQGTAGGFHVEMMELIGAGNNPMVGMTVAVAAAVEEASK